MLTPGRKHIDININKYEDWRDEIHGCRKRVRRNR